LTSLVSFVAGYTVKAEPQHSSESEGVCIFSNHDLKKTSEVSCAAKHEEGNKKNVFSLDVKVSDVTRQDIAIRPPLVPQEVPEKLLPVRHKW
jgi:hypothetical protein